MELMEIVLVELGILVWQDFQFACGVYPAHDEFVANVRQEAVDNVKRLRHHASVAVFCGNNEDYQQVLQWGGMRDRGLPPLLPLMWRVMIRYWRTSRKKDLRGGPARNCV